MRQHEREHERIRRDLNATVSCCEAGELARELPDELFRHRLGLPPDFPADPKIDALADDSRAWYAEHGSPWAQAALIDVRHLESGEVDLADGQTWRSPLLAAGFREAEVEAVMVLGVSAGAALDAEVDRRWRGERPDEAMFLSAYGVAVAEFLRSAALRRMRELLARIDRTVLPHYSPGYEGWGLEDQAALFASLDDPGPLRVLRSGGLQPSKSTLAAIGVTPRQDLVDQLAGFWSRQLRDVIGARELSWQACPGCPSPETCRQLQSCGSSQTTQAPSKNS